MKMTPFGFKTARELFDNVVKQRFEKLCAIEDLSGYYDYIFSAGALRDWIINENGSKQRLIDDLNAKDKKWCAFYSVNNNAKHFKLSDEKAYNVILDAESILPADDKGNLIWNDGFVWNDKSVWFDEASGECGKFPYVCIIEERDTRIKENVFLFELCKYVYNKLESML